MDIKQYVDMAIVTEAPPSSIFKNILEEYPDTLQALAVPIRLLHATMGICTEVGELVEQLGNTAPFNPENVFEELGDAFWYTALFRDTYGIDKVPVGGNPQELETMIYDMTAKAAALLDIAKKTIFYGRVYPFETIEKCFFALEGALLDLCAYFDFVPGEVRAANIKKLAARYGDKFTAAAANNRNIATEMVALGFGSTGK